jgi:hypothetical protein
VTALCDDSGRAHFGGDGSRGFVLSEPASPHILKPDLEHDEEESHDEQDKTEHGQPPTCGLLADAARLSHALLGLGPVWPWRDPLERSFEGGFAKRRRFGLLVGVRRGSDEGVDARE